MPRFLKLTNMVLNTSSISSIRHHVTQLDASYIIHTKDLDFIGFVVFGNGFVGNKNSIINVQRSLHPLDYDKIHKWIEDATPADFI